MDITSDWNRERKRPERRQMYIEATKIYNAKVNDLKRKLSADVNSETSWFRAVEINIRT